MLKTGVTIGVTMKFIAIDVQGFLNPPNFIPKEIAITNGKQTEHYLIKPPLPFEMLSHDEKTQVRYLEQSHHGLRFSSGYIDYSLIPNLVRAQILNANVDLIYVKGHQKVEFLKKLFSIEELSSIKVINLEDGKCEMACSKTRPLCFSHNLKECVCALTNCWMLYNYVFSLLPQ